jgi:cytidine deaminase
MNIDREQLMRQAVAASDAAYAPYSKYPVGAALLTESGEIILGCNVENASFGLTNCAERTAIFSAVAAGHRRFLAIAISTEDAGAPCGACRQVLNEFSPGLLVILGDRQGGIHRTASLEALLPDAFGPNNVNRL